MHRLCRATVEWRDDVGDLAADLSRAGRATPDAGARKGLLVGYVDAAAARTRRLVVTVAAEAPDDAVARRVEQAGDDLDRLLAAARAEAVAFPDDDDPEPFVSRGIQVTNELEKVSSRWRTSVAELRAGIPALEPAFAATPACRVIPRTADTD